MKNTIKFLGIIALAAAIGFSMTSCGGGGGGGDNSLRITGITQAQVLAGYALSIYVVTPLGTTRPQLEPEVQAIVSFATGGGSPPPIVHIVAGNNSDDSRFRINPDPAAGGSGPFTVNTPLFAAAGFFDSRWRGEGEYAVWIILINTGGVITVHRTTSSVQFNGGGRVVLHAVNDFTPIP